MEKLTLNINQCETKGLIGSGPVDISELSNSPKKIFIVDENVYKFHKNRFSGENHIIVPPGEAHKSLGYAENIYRKLIELEADRDAFIVGVGGGLVTDLSGFVASTFMRGVDFGFISTTLLGQVDASIGGKNGVNLDGYKNMIGVVRQPEFVVCDIDLLETLDKKELASGFAEVIKYGVIKDEGLFDFLESGYQDILALEPEPLKVAIKSSCAIKINIVESDVNEKGDRRLLNFGHTIGHAIEKLTGIMHGEAVAIGMVMASKLSVNLGFMQMNDYDRVHRMIKNSGLPDHTDIDPMLIYDTLLKDKKRTGDQIHFILTNRIGEAFIHKMPLSDLKSAVHDLY